MCARQVLAGHELGHLFGISHADEPCIFCFQGGLTVDPTFVPMQPEPGDVWGADVRPDLCETRSDFNTIEGQNDHRIREPGEPGVMLSTVASNRWMDLLSYEHILPSSVLACDTDQEGSPPPTVLLLMSAHDPATMESGFAPLIEVDGESLTVTDLSGDVFVRAFDGAQQLMELQVATSPVSECAPGAICPSGFQAYLPLAHGSPHVVADRYEVVEVSTGQLLGQLSASSSAPSASFTNLVAGQTLFDGAIDWSGSDADGDDVVYYLSYSWDGGVSSVPLLVNSSSTSYDLVTADLPGSDPGMAQLTLAASDGFHTTEVEVRSLTLGPLKPPSVTILAPEHAPMAFEGTLVQLSGQAYDPEDGKISDPGLIWLSDLDGVLGSGQQLQVTTLSLGERQLTLMATDSDGMTGQASVTFEVLSYPDTSPWTDWGNGLAGTYGKPILVGSGDFQPGGSATINLFNALEDTTAVLVIGFSNLHAPLLGGTLVPFPDILVFDLPVDAQGGLVLSAPLPPGIGEGSSVYLQVFVTDAAGPQGFAASNGLSATVY